MPKMAPKTGVTIDMATIRLDWNCDVLYATEWASTEIKSVKELN